MGNQAGSDSFISEGFSNLKKPEQFHSHVGGPNSVHNQAQLSCHSLMKQKEHIEVVLSKQLDQVWMEYRTRLTASIDCIRFLLRQELAFRCHDETEDSKNQGNFLGFLHFLAHHNEDINNVVLKNAPKNLKLISPKIIRENKFSYYVHWFAHQLQLMNNCLVTYIENDIFDNIDNEKIVQRFQNMKIRRGQL
ncbi:DUF4371 domain-containing protein [Cephalotus follicularis]|uniref:DUF4371 domain-containing protein n=1 Tax=Cephalotus follicularis TaxID=3775 RepID=A0A1Q3DG12_CEPFO|nr:DUF4371 domain-containing protein [Cephalotus follicularis]